MNAQPHTIVIAIDLIEPEQIGSPADHCIDHFLHDPAIRDRLQGELGCKVGLRKVSFPQVPAAAVTLSKNVCTSRANGVPHLRVVADVVEEIDTYGAVVKTVALDEFVSKLVELYADKLNLREKAV